VRINLYNSAIRDIAEELNLANIAIGLRSGHQTISFLAVPNQPSGANLTHRVWKIAKTTVKASIFLGRVDIGSPMTILGAGMFLAAANIFGSTKVNRPWELSAKLWMNTPEAYSYIC